MNFLDMFHCVIQVSANFFFLTFTCITETIFA